MKICNDDCLHCPYADCIKVRGNVQRAEMLRKDQRVITIARRDLGWTMDDLAERIYTSKSAVSKYESGLVRAPWELLYRVMPELREMRENGCAYYCDQSHLCRLGRCKYGRRGRPRKEG